MTIPASRTPEEELEAARAAAKDKLRQDPERRADVLDRLRQSTTRVRLPRKEAEPRTG